MTAVMVNRSASGLRGIRSRECGRDTPGQKLDRYGQGHWAAYKRDLAVVLTAKFGIAT
jgi:hypothetical protein